MQSLGVVESTAMVEEANEGLLSEGEGFSQSEAACLPADQSNGRFSLID